MITFTRGDLRFNYRITGVAICDGKVLLQKPVVDGFWFLPGGRAELQETAEETLRREMSAFTLSDAGLGSLFEATDER
jgi:8-oxo-dGTP pyrophosphatase MutT (NUDIX family)